MPTVRESLARREAIRTDLAAIQAATPAGDLPADAQTRWDALSGELRSIDGSMSRQAQLDELDRTAQGNALDHDPRFNELRNGVGILDAIRSQMPAGERSHGTLDRAAGQALEASQEMARRSGRTPQGVFWSMRTAAPGTEQRVTTTGANGTATIGAGLVGTDHRPDLFIDSLRNATVVRALGARVVADLRGNVDVPRRDGSVTASWVGENQAIPESDQAFGKVTLSPKHCGALTELSRNQIMQSSPDIEALTRDDMAKVLALALDTGALLGDGTGANPKGIVPSATARATYAGAAPAWSDVLGLMGTLDLANVVPNAWVEGPGMRSLLMGTLKAPGGVTGYIQETMNELAGLPARGVNVMPAGSLLLGDWSDVLIGLWSELDILVNPYADSVFSKGNVAIRAMLTCDIALRHAASFALLLKAAS